MKRVFSVIALAIGCLTLAASARAQMGMDIFSRPSFSKIFNPVVGNGAVYQQLSPDSKSPGKDITMFVVGKEAIGTRRAGGWSSSPSPMSPAPSSARCSSPRTISRFTKW